jgi:hypothetical protein
MKHEAMIRRQVRDVGLDTKLTDEEKNAAAMEAAKLQDKAEAQEEAIKEEQAEAKAVIKKIKGDARELRANARTGLRFQRVDVQEVFDIKAGRAWFEYRGERYQEREMNEREKALARQGTLFEANGLVVVDPPTLKNGDDFASNETRAAWKDETGKKTKRSSV